MQAAFLYFRHMIPLDMGQFRRSLLGWYRKNHRQLPWRDTDDPYLIWVSEVMLQQTQVKTVIPYYLRFVAAFPSVNDLAASSQQAVLKLWEGLGYYARARNLHRAAKQVSTDFAGRIPDELEAIKQLPGVGDYIAAAVLSIAYNRAHPVVDGNVKRVLARLLQIDLPVNRPTHHRRFYRTASDFISLTQPGLFNQGMMELGALVCKPRRPDCAECPVDAACLSYRNDQVEFYPKRAKRPPVPTHHLAIGIICRNDKVLITRRKPDGLLGGLWEFPGGKLKTGETAEAACMREILEEVNLSVDVLRPLTRISHAYTHFKILADVFICRSVKGRIRLRGPTDYRWISLEEIHRFPFPKANHKFIPLLLEDPDILGAAS